MAKTSRNPKGEEIGGGDLIGEFTVVKKANQLCLVKFLFQKPSDYRKAARQNNRDW